MMKLPNTAIAQSVFRFMRCESGATAIEYAMIASGIGAAIAATIVTLGSSVQGLYQDVYTTLK